MLYGHILDKGASAAVVVSNEEGGCSANRQAISDPMNPRGIESAQGNGPIWLVTNDPLAIRGENHVLFGLAVFVSSQPYLRGTSALPWAP